jgi:ABC-2 type transport system ATP-binding protein/lipopolysaccharide transport system ATP-binding protein
MVARIGFAVATLTSPEILIVDEILAVGDYLFQEKCEKRIREMMSGGTTVIIVSHAIDQIRRLCKHVCGWKKGHIKMIGEMQPVTDAYMTHPQA